MTQSDVLELAKQGNPQAIASLMNLVLQPKGVTVKASLQDRCLHILFASAAPLSQPALVSFARTGLANLLPGPVEQVKLYAQKTGQKTPLWTDGFQLGRQSPVSPAPTVARPTAPISLNLPAVEPALPRVSPPNFQPVAVAFEEPPLQQEELPLQEEAGVPMAPPPRLPKKGMKRPKNRWQFYLQKLLYQVQHGNRYVLASVVGLGAFAIGGTVAILIYSQAHSESRLASGTLVPSGNSFVQASGKPSADSQQAYAKNYLLQMNKAQQNFYKQNNRFAANLEELERSAALISQSSGYTYKLILRDDTQAVVTAIPKVDDLKSYAGTVVLTKAATPNWPTSAIVCETNKPSTVAPVLPQALDGPIQCPADSSAVH